MKSRPRLVYIKSSWSFYNKGQMIKSNNYGIEKGL